MLKWLAIALFCISLITGCASQNSQPAPQPVSNTPTNLSASANIENKDPSENKTGFSNYDAIVVSRIQNSWYKVLKGNDYEVNYGKVIIKFMLHSDGTISNIKTIRDDCGFPSHYFCVRAIKKSAPFPRWTPEMIKQLGDYLDVQSTFDYSTSP